MAKSRQSGLYGIRWWCPGCECMHMVPTKPLAPTTDRPGAPDGWDFNGDYERPTLAPSVLVHGHESFIDTDLEGEALTAPENIRMTPTCHTFIREGRIEFLSDCTHALAGQTVELDDLPESEEQR